MGPIERAIRRSVRPRSSLSTPTGRGVFKVHAVDDRGIVLLLGAKAAWTPLTWHCLEGIGDVLAGGHWVPVGMTFSRDSTSGTLDEYLKRRVDRGVAGYVAALLEAAAVVDLDRRTPVRIRARGGEPAGRPAGQWAVPR